MSYPNRSQLSKKQYKEAIFDNIKLFISEFLFQILYDFKNLLISHSNRLFAFGLHVLLLMSAPHQLFEFMPKTYVFLVSSFVCVITTYLFFNNHKSYDVFNFEEFYIKNHLFSNKTQAL